MFALYRSLLGCLCLSVLLACATTAPYQQLSETKQTLLSAKQLLTSENNTTQTEDTADYQAAEAALAKAEQALLEKRHEAAKQWLSTSREKSLAIIKRHPNSNIQFRY